MIQVLKLIPESVIPANHIGMRIPSRRQDLPAIVIAIGEVKESPIGIGEMVGMQRVSDNQWIEVTGSKTSGLLSIEIWAASEEEMNEVTGTVFQIVEASEGKLRGMGFIKFGNSELKPVENVTVARQGAVRRVIRYSIIYEEIKVSTVGPGGIIRQVHVEIDDQFQEKMDLP